MSLSGRHRSVFATLESTAAWLLAILWLSPLIYAFWSAFHPAEYAIRFELFAPLTLENFRVAWDQAPFARYFVNTFMLVTSILAAQFVLCTLAAYAFARSAFYGKSVAFVFVLLQLMIMPEVLIVENYTTMAKLNLVDTITGVGLPTWQAPLVSSCCGRPSRQFRRNWRMRHGLRVAAASGPAEGLCAAGEADICRLRAGVGELPLEQFSVASCDYQFG